MKTSQALKLIKEYQEWRRYDGEIGEGPDILDPKEIGEALDVLIRNTEEFINGIR